MADQRLNSDGNLRLRFYPPTAFVNYQWPTVAELNAGTNLADAVPWEDYAFGVQASDTSDGPPISAKSSVAQRTQANYGGNISFWYPGTYDDDGNQLSLVYDLVDTPRTSCYIVTSVDGETGDPGQPDEVDFANGDFLSVYRCMTDAWDDMTEGDDPYRYIINFLKNGGLAHYTVASTAAPVLAVTPGTLSLAAGAFGIVNATVNARRYTRGVAWSSSDPTIATVSQNGVVTAVAAGTATITATLRGTTVATTEECEVTVTA